MKKHLSLLLLFLAGSFGFSLHAELVWKPGYVILASGDSVKGDVHVNTKKELNMFSRISFRQGEAQKTYKPEQVKEYGYDDVKFLARDVDGEKSFLKVLSYGRIILFEYQYEVQRGNDLVVDSDYYMEKNDGSNSGLTKVKMGKFKKLAAEMMSDNTDLVQRVQNDDKKYEITDVQKVIDEYNSWYEQQNTLQGSR
ncbi:MAG TPA: hypothetical protein VFU15_01840 [Bacteroidia bacterium]|nr:hypothetical protein [Bacteroidia bacterium]